jgi:hypothetical protein
MGISKWFKNQMMAISVALSNVEKSALGQGGEMLTDDTNTVQRHRQGMLSDDLLQGRVTEEVITLRARIYKVLEATQSYNYATGERGYKVDLGVDKRIQGEPSDEYKVEMVVNNERITSDFLTSCDDIDAKQDVPIMIGRSITPKFKIEDYTKKLYIKNIGDDYKLLEFFINKYPDKYDKKTNFLIKDIEKAIKNPRVSDLLDINEIAFISHDTLGVLDFLEFKYDVIGFDKIVDYDGNYVIKFKCKTTVNGDNILEKYSDDELNERYKNKEKR